MSGCFFFQMIAGANEFVPVFLRWPAAFVFLAFHNAWAAGSQPWRGLSSFWREILGLSDLRSPWAGEGAQKKVKMKEGALQLVSFVLSHFLESKRDPLHNRKGKIYLWCKTFGSSVDPNAWLSAAKILPIPSELGHRSLILASPIQCRECQMALMKGSQFQACCGCFYGKTEHPISHNDRPMMKAPVCCPHHTGIWILRTFNPSCTGPATLGLHGLALLTAFWVNRKSEINRSHRVDLYIRGVWYKQQRLIKM